MITSIEDYDFELPPRQIAAEALTDRADSRMLVVNRAGRDFADAKLSTLGKFLRSGDRLVLNNTKVFPARLYGRTETGSRIEVFLVEELGDNTWSVLAKPGRRLAPGKVVTFDEGLAAEVVE